MMLQVEAEIERHQIDRSVIGRHAVAAVEGDVFLQDMCARRMRSDCEIGGQQKIGDRVRAQEPADGHPGNRDRRNVSAYGRCATGDIGVDGGSSVFG